MYLSWSFLSPYSLFLPSYILYINFSFFHLRWLLKCVVIMLGTASLVAQPVKNPPAMWETWVWSLGWEGPLEKGKATHSSILAWRIPWSVVHGITNSWTQLSDFHFHMPESSSVHWWGFQTVVALAGYLADTNIFRSFLEGWTKVPKTLWIICLEVMWNMGAEYRIKSEGS